MVSYVKKGSVKDNLGPLTTGRSTPDIPNHGVSILTNTSDEQYVMAAPTFGVEKTLVFVKATSAAGPTVWLSTDGGAIKVAGATSLNTAQKIVAGASTAYQVVTLLGINSTMWAVRSCFPVASSAPGPTFATS